MEGRGVADATKNLTEGIGVPVFLQLVYLEVSHWDLWLIGEYVMIRNSGMKCLLICPGKHLSNLQIYLDVPIVDSNLEIFYKVLLVET